MSRVDTHVLNASFVNHEDIVESRGGPFECQLPLGAFRVPSQVLAVL